jgi:hypothetical protein
LETENIPIEIQQIMELQSEALQFHQNLWDTFSKDSEGLPVYPAEFAGSTLDNGKLVIHLTDLDTEWQENYRQRCNAENDDIIFRQTEYSLNDLSVFYSYAQDYLENDNLVSCGPLLEENEYEITLKNSAAIQWNRSVSTATAVAAGFPIRIAYQDVPQVAATAVWGGDGIRNESSGSSMTVGICGTFGGNPALLTCGHENDKNTYVKYKSTSNRLGQVVFHRANQAEAAAAQGVNSLGDFSIIKLTNSAYTTSNKISNNLSITGTYSSLPVGTKIYKYGVKTGLTSGTVTQYLDLTTCKYKSFGSVYHVRGLYKHKMDVSSGKNGVDEGDSGGPVYVKSGNNYLLHGIVSVWGATNSNVDESLLVKDIMYSTPVFFAVDAGFTVKTS